MGMPPTANWYIVSYLGGIEVRQEPHFDAPRTGALFNQNEVIPICEEIDGGDGRIYLRLMDGSGWIFDDSQLMPQDPSVIRGSWMSSPVPPAPPAPPAPPEASAACVLSTNAPRIAVSQFRVAYLGGIRVRTAPSIESPSTGTTLMQGEVFSVAEEIQGADGRLYLRLCNQPGWAFDDSALVPQDPSAVRECWEHPVAYESYESNPHTTAHGMPDVATSMSLLSTSPTAATAEAAEGWQWDASWNRRGRGRRSKRGGDTTSRRQPSRRR